MRAALAKESSKRIAFYCEQLDANRFAVGPRDPELFAALAKKYDGLQIDVVVTVTATVDFLTGAPLAELVASVAKEPADGGRLQEAIN